MFVQQIAGLPGKRLVDFQYQEAVVAQTLLRGKGDGLVETQRVVVGHKEGQRGVVVEDVALHLSPLALHNIRRVADNKVKSGRREAESRVEEIGLDEVDGCAIASGILPCHLQRS